LLFWHREEITARLASELDHFVDEMVNGEGLSGFQTFLEQLKRNRVTA
ncbi:MAG: hypothetical protein GY805_23405, partial [Chloroflexi bacterium]|nr:hypothetical protein [Chloroflexota bacterium]